MHCLETFKVFHFNLKAVPRNRFDFAKAVLRLEEENKTANGKSLSISEKHSFHCFLLQLFSYFFDPFTKESLQTEVTF